MKRLILTIGIVVFMFLLIVTANYNKLNSPYVIFHENTNYGPIWVYGHKEVKCLSFEEPPSNVNQTCVYNDNYLDTPHSYPRMLLSTLFFKNSPRRILIIGLGGGLIPNQFEKLVPEAQIDVVEINGEIAEAARKYFNFKETPLKHVIIDDGLDYVANYEDEKYDIVIIDVYGSEYIPPGFLKHEFIQNVKKITSDSGIIAINTFAKSEYKDVELELFQKNFSNYYSLNNGNSHIMIAPNLFGPTLETAKRNSVSWRYRFTEVNTSTDKLVDIIKLGE